MADAPDAPRLSAHSIPAPEASERMRAQTTASYEASPDEVNRVLLLYSGGLDTSVMLKWIQDEYDAEVVTLTVNLGQPGEDYEEVEGKARQLGAVDTFVVDAREEFANDFIAPAIKANAIYGLAYPLFTALGRPLIAKLAVDYARQSGCDTIAHGCTGKGNDQVRIESTIATLAPELKIIAPGPLVGDGPRRGDRLRARARDPGQGRRRVGAVLDRRQPLGALERGQVDRGPLARARGRRLPARHAARARARRARDRRADLRARPAGRRRRAADGPRRPARARRRAGHEARRRDRRPHRGPDRRPQGPRHLRGAGRAIVLAAHAELEKLIGTIHQNQFKPQLDRQWAYLVYAGLWWEPLRENLDAYMDSVNELVTGHDRLKLYKGSVRPVTRSSPNAVYDAQLATFAESGGLFSQQASPGFIEIWSLQSRMAWRLRNSEKSS
jgi:argininosuccinate synthase